MPNTEIIDEKDARLAGVTPDTSDAAIAARARAELEALEEQVAAHRGAWHSTYERLMAEVTAGETTAEEMYHALKELGRSTRLWEAQQVAAYRIVTGLDPD